jgi:hypothetical protein
VRGSLVVRKIVHGTIDAATLAELLQVLDQQGRVEGVRVIEILLGALFQMQVRKVLVIMVLLKDQNAFRRQSGNDPLRNGCLPRASASANPDDQALRHKLSS